MKLGLIFTLFAGFAVACSAGAEGGASEPSSSSSDLSDAAMPPAWAHVATYDLWRSHGSVITSETLRSGQVSQVEYEGVLFPLPGPQYAHSSVPAGRDVLRCGEYNFMGDVVRIEGSTETDPGPARADDYPILRRDKAAYLYRKEIVVRSREKIGQDDTDRSYKESSALSQAAFESAVTTLRQSDARARSWATSSNKAFDVGLSCAFTGVEKDVYTCSWREPKRLLPTVVGTELASAPELVPVTMAIRRSEISPGSISNFANEMIAGKWHAVARFSYNNGAATTTIACNSPASYEKVAATNSASRDAQWFRYPTMPNE